jgi:hypothetical protein
MTRLGNSFAVFFFLLALFAFSREQRALAMDVELDMSNEISENTRNIVFGIKCGCCKAVTAEIGLQFKEILDKTAKREGEEKSDAKTVFRSKYVGQFNEKLEIALDRMCRPPPTKTTSKRAIEKSASVAKLWRYSESGAKAIQNSMFHINTLGQNATEDDLREMERVLLGIQLFTNDANKHYVNPDPKVAENTGGTNLMADSYVTAELLDACRRVSESLELEDQLDEAKKNGEFGVNEQHKTCIDLDYCKVRKGGAKAKDTRTKEQKDKDEALERMKQLFVSKEEMDEFKQNNPDAFDEDKVDPLDETLDSPAPKKKHKKSVLPPPREEDEEKEEKREEEESKNKGKSGGEGLFASVKEKFNDYFHEKAQNEMTTTSSRNEEGGGEL